MHTSGLAELLELFAQVLLIVGWFKRFTEFFGKVILVGEGISHTYLLEIPVKSSSLKSSFCIVDLGIDVFDSLGKKDISDL